MAKQITVIGTGYVGLVTSVGLADFGNYVTGVDINKSIVDKLNHGEPTIYEHGLEEYLDRNLQSGRLSFSTDVSEAVKKSDIVFLAVGTPPKTSGEADLSQIQTAAQAIADNLTRYTVIVTKSTVPVGTNRWIKGLIEARNPEAAFDVVSNPEFLREGKAVQDFFHPDRIVLGCETETAKEYLQDVYRALNLIHVPFVWCNLETAELIKYASNAFLATKITFINQMANLAEAVGADIHTIARSMGMDGRISPKFLHPGPGYGGSCFPKDTRAIASTGDKYGVNMSVIKEVIDANEYQKTRMADKLKGLLGDLEGKPIAVLGLTFKAETDDVRESPAISMVEKLVREKAVVHVHDPKGLANFRLLFGDGLHYHENEFEALHDVEAMVVMTEWNEYRNLDLLRARDVMAGNIILDTRNVMDADRARELGFAYSGVGR
ncbi:MAG: UDP-glucose dehydrogenase family protein [Spirochaetaceae bacterium]